MFYSRLNGLCIDNGWKITNFSTEILGVSNSAATSWKKGTSPNSAVIVAAAKFFKVSADYLLGLSDEMRPTSDLDTEEAELLTAWRGADQEHRDLALSALRLGQQRKGAVSSLSGESDLPAAL